MASEESSVMELEDSDKTSPKNIPDPETCLSDSTEHWLPNEHSGNVTSEETDWVYLEEVPEYMKCNIICCNVFEAPRLVTCCGRNYCKKCIERHLQRTAVLEDQKPFCPVCRKEDFKLIKNAALELSIDQLKVQCPYQSNGCGWTGTLQNGKLHLTECDFLPIDCPNNCGCKRFERCRLSDHMAECPLRSVSCSFGQVGCTDEKFLIHGNMAQTHAVDNIHLRLLLVAQLNARISTGCNSCRSKYGGNSQMNSETIYSQNKTLESLQSVITSLKVSLQETQQKIDALKQEIAREAICLTELKKKGEQIKSTVTSCKKMTTEQVQALPLPKSTGIFCPPVTFTVNHFWKRMMIDDMWLSPPFYTHIGGYKMCLSVYPNGYKHSTTDHGRSVSAYLHFMTGEFDDHLNWPFPGAIFTLTAIRQQGYGGCNKSVHLELEGKDTRYIRSRHIDGSLGYGCGSRATFLHHDALPYFLNRDSLDIMIYRIQFLPL